MADERIVVSVDLPYACFGLIIERGIVVEAAPIAGWATGKPAREVLEYFKRKGAKLERCGPPKTPRSGVL